MEEKQTVSNNQPLEYTIELVEGDISEKPNIKDYKIELVEDEIKTQEEETNLGQISEARKPFWKRIKEVSNNTLPILKTSVFSKIKSGSKKIKDVITSAIDKFVEKNAWYEYREGKIAESAAKLVSDARGLEVQKAQL